MRRYILAVILILASCSLFAACGSNETLANALAPAISGLDATPANVTAILWVQGLYNAADGAGTDSTGIGSVDGACGYGLDYVLLEGTCGGSAAGTYWLYTDWLTLAYDGCPLATGAERAVLLAYDTAGNYTLQSRLKSEAWTTWDSLGTIPAAHCSIPTGVVIQNGGTTVVDVTWDNTAAGLYGSYSGTQPSRLLTTFDVWFYQGAVPPVSFVVPGAGWTAGTAGIATSTATTVGMTIPYTAGQYTYMTRRFYAEGIALPTASNNYTTVAIPSGAPTMSGVSAVNSGLNTSVNWTSGDESQVTGYQVFFAPTGGEFTAVGNRIDAAGNNHDYSTSVRIPSTSGFTVKVGAYLTSGDVEYSSPVSVKVTNIINDKTRVTVD